MHSRTLIKQQQKQPATGLPYRTVPNRIYGSLSKLLSWSINWHRIALIAVSLLCKTKIRKYRKRKGKEKKMKKKLEGSRIKKCVRWAYASFDDEAVVLIDSPFHSGIKRVIHPSILVSSLSTISNPLLMRMSWSDCRLYLLHCTALNYVTMTRLFLMYLGRFKVTPSSLDVNF